MLEGTKVAKLQSCKVAKMGSLRSVEFVIRQQWVLGFPNPIFALQML